MTQHVTFHDLKGASVFITGGGSGIGAALTEGFVAQGARVAFVQRSDATAFCDQIEQRHGIRPLFIPCDITDIAALQDAMAQAAAAHGDITVLVNNAANDARHRLEDLGVEDWDRSIAVNLRPHFFTAQAAAPMMRRAGGGSIINFSSISYMMGNAGYPAYATAKAGITGLTRALARELGPDRIRVNALMPGWVLTDRQLELWATPEDLAAHLARQCLKEHLKPQDIVDATLFLASNASRMMTGQAMVVDGGVVVTG
ncbi:NAD(P)-dependent dehydrogenase (short-subunit alcohol dehydrogenase family) [Albidovulum inexpectatum]|uniref:NAD(P)-dependent dehydrogenase (Short-subunit alcohol dehydrogenase family) n=1 Tax=Albidovulum inexpectatum TaxID=196587 RepID=A0A2S5JHK2_9RHOB|nr:SDR family oxidoreductase [Albidovulum inexpectatum]PPB80775.1 NAD(P)-dependent dehydrogenase (short-subunit alcohol dehydrogenase family) [Albidovulum inexpectatum]